MACTYIYSTGEVTLDFHLVNYGEICTLRGIRGKVGAPGCLTCPYHNGSEMDSFSQYYVKCKHPKAKDSEGSGSVKSRIRDRFILQALEALCY